MTELYSYFRISEAGKKLNALYEKCKDDAIFLVPTTLDKDTLTDLILKKASVFGKRPNIMTLSELLGKLAENAGQTLHVIDPPDHKLILKHIVEKYKTDNAGNEFPAGMSHQGFVTLLSDNIHMLIKEGVKPSLIKERLADTLEGDNPEKILCDLYENYLGYLSANNLIDSVQTPDKILEYLKNDTSFLKGKTLVIVGFSTFTGNQLALFEALCNICSCEFIMPRTGISYKYFRGGIQQLGTFENMPKAAALENSVKPLKIKKLEANNRNLEYMAIARELALWKLNKGKLAEDFGELSDFGQIAILAAPQSLDSVENELRRYGIPYNVVLRGTVHDTPLGRLPQQIWAAYTSVWDTDETAALLSDPLLSPDGFNQRDYVKVFPSGEDSWRKKLEGNEAALSLFDRLTILCSRLKAGGTPAQILTMWKDFLCTLNVTHTASKLVQDDAEFDYTVKNLSTALHELDKKSSQLEGAENNTGPAAKLAFKGKDAVAFLLDWASTATLPIQLAQKNCVTLYGKAPATFEQHDFWIMTDIDASTWPGVLRESPLLRKEQVELINQKEENEEEIILKSAHIPTVAEQREQKELLLRRLLATAGKGAIIARSTTDANGRPQGESLFVTRLFDTDNKQPALFEPCGDPEKPIKYALAQSLPQEGDDWFEGAELPENMPKTDRGELPRRAEYIQEEPTVSQSQLDTWTECPYRYWCRKVKLNEYDNDAYNTLYAGNFNHALWESYWRQPEENRGSLTAYVEANWNNETLREEYPALSAKRLARYDAMLKEQALAVAELQDEIEKNAKAHGRLSVEVEIPIKDTDGSNFEIDGVSFLGKFDRIDIYPGNKAVILDYKLNKAEKHADDLQLPAYACLLKKLRGLDVAGFCWLGHGDGKLYGYFSDEMAAVYGIEEKSVCQNADARDAQIAKAEKTLNKIAAAVNDGTFKANYNARRHALEKGDSVCQTCEYQTLCRRRENPFYTEESEEGTEE